MTRMHVDELEINEALVRRLLAEQFPEWDDLPLSRVEPDGTVHAIFRLGDRLSVRLARREGPTAPGGKEIDWLPRLARLLPLDVPVPVAQGRPNSEYPWFWDVHAWVEGETVPVEEIDAIRAALDLAGFVGALQQVDPVGAPRGRGIPLAERDGAFRYWLARFDGDPAVAVEWERALAAPTWEGPPVWHHGDLDVRNWLVRDGRIAGVIDWGEMGVGDPACDVMVAWKLHSSAARDAFRQALPTDDATWERARGWVLSQAVAALAYYTPENNPTLHHEATRWLELVLSEGDGAAGLGHRRRWPDRMSAEDVVEVLDALECAGVPIWVDGGWGVDALVGEETRPHADLDLAVDRAFLDPATSALEALGFRHEPGANPGFPARLVMRDARSRQVDLHPLIFDVDGDGWQQLAEQGRAWGRYPAAHLQTVGTIGGRRVRCLSPELQVRFRLTHEWTERDQQDLNLLVSRFADVPVPPPLWDASARSERVGPGRRPRHDMDGEEVLTLVKAFERSGVRVWLDGGWGVDALLGRQTRPHDDLDLVVALVDVPRLQDVLAGRGYAVVGGGAPMSFELVDEHGRQVDVHPVAFNERGDGVYLMRTGREWSYPAAGFAGNGSVLGREVHCLSAEVQVVCHEGYDLDSEDLRDLHALREAFGVRLP